MVKVRFLVLMRLRAALPILQSMETSELAVTARADEHHVFTTLPDFVLTKLDTVTVTVPFEVAVISGLSVMDFLAIFFAPLPTPIVGVVASALLMSLWPLLLLLLLALLYALLVGALACDSWSDQHGFMCASFSDCIRELGSWLRGP